MSATAAAFAKRAALSGWDPVLICAQAMLLLLRIENAGHIALTKVGWCTQSQIAALQAANYVTLGFILFMLDSVSGHPLTMQQVFSPNALRVHSVFGGVTIMAHLLNSVAGSAPCHLFGAMLRPFHLTTRARNVRGVLLVFIVERAKQCLDFTVTRAFEHLFLASTGFDRPGSLWLQVTAHVLNLINCCLYEGFPVNWEWWLTTVVGVTIMAVLGEVLCMRYEVRDIPLRLNSSSNSAQDKDGL